MLEGLGAVTIFIGWCVAMLFTLWYCQAPNVWSRAYESLWFHGVAVVLLRCGAVGGAERSEAEPQAPQRRAYSAGVR